MKIRTTKNIQYKTMKIKTLLEVHGPWILVEFSGLLLEIATIAFVFKVCELDSPFLNILKL
jgi:hypothetical protein